MDILLDKDGDLVVTDDGNIVLANSVAQKIRIRLLWFEGEWRWMPDEGLPYKDNLLVKDPDTDLFESMIREKIFDVDEVTAVEDVDITTDYKTRKANISFTAKTDEETINEEVTLDV